MNITIPRKQKFYKKKLYLWLIICDENYIYIYVFIIDFLLCYTVIIFIPRNHIQIIYMMFIMMFISI